MKLGKDWALVAQVSRLVKACHYSPYAIIQHFQTTGWPSQTRICEKTLYSYIAADDIPARWGGDEFTALLSVSSPKSLEAVKSRLQGTIDDFNRKQSRVWKLNISMGHALFEKSSKDTLEGLISFADAEMYESRRAKRLE